jgi:hypothetical protein
MHGVYLKWFAVAAFHSSLAASADLPTSETKYLKHPTSKAYALLGIDRLESTQVQDRQAPSALVQHTLSIRFQFVAVAGKGNKVDANLNSSV